MDPPVQILCLSRIILVSAVTVNASVICSIKSTATGAYFRPTSGSPLGLRRIEGERRRECIYLMPQKTVPTSAVLCTINLSTCTLILHQYLPPNLCPKPLPALDGSKTGQPN